MHAFLCGVLLILGQAGTFDRGALQYGPSLARSRRRPPPAAFSHRLPPFCRAVPRYGLSVMQQACVNQYFVVLGIATACLSTALGSMFGSARIMQALARDRIYPVLAPLGAGSPVGDEPRRALVLTYLIAQVCVHGTLEHAGRARARTFPGAYI